MKKQLHAESSVIETRVAPDKESKAEMAKDIERSALKTMEGILIEKFEAF